MMHILPCTNQTSLAKNQVIAGCEIVAETGE